MDLQQLLPPEGVKIVVVLFLSFLLGLEREEKKASAEGYAFGGVRTYPLIGLIGYALALLSGPQFLPVAIGFAVVGSFMLVAYRHKISAPGGGGATSEMSALGTYLVGALVHYDYFWIATTLVVISLLLLELKGALESIAQRTAPGEILTFAQFLLLSAVILPVLPDTPFGPFRINPFRTWLVVVAVSSLSYGSYVLQKATRGQGGVVLAALLGGAYSSTVMTVVLARRARQQPDRPHLFAGGMLMSSGTMYLRLAALVALFNGALLDLLVSWFIALAAVGLVGGWFWTRVPDPGSEPVERRFEPKNPLELGAALLFAAIFLVILVGTHYAVLYLGRMGVYALAAIMGVTDVDPFIMGMTQSAGVSTSFTLAARAILLAAASNNVVKGIYAALFARGVTGRQGLIALVLLAVCGLLPLLVVR